MTNDYKKGHAYRMKTDRNYRERHNGSKKFITPRRPRGHKCRCGRYSQEYHHYPKGGGRWICKRCHSKIHGNRRGKTPYKNY